MIAEGFIPVREHSYGCQSSVAGSLIHQDKVIMGRVAKRTKKEFSFVPTEYLPAE